VSSDIVDQEATMDADLDLLLISVDGTADDLCPSARQCAAHAQRRRDRQPLRRPGVVDRIPYDRRFLQAAKRQLGHLFPRSASSGR
jgi:hypothetical protein